MLPEPMRGEAFMPRDFARFRRLRRRAAGALVFALVVLAAAVVMIPLRTILPFKAQTPQGVALSYVLTRWGPAFTLAAVLAALALTAWLWRGARRWSRAALVLALVPLAAAAWTTRTNRFEKLFAPPGDVRHAAAAEASWVAPAEMVLAVEVAGDTVAYPIRQVAYHHVVQDVVGGVPIAATY
jgi:hypothetical protein